MVQIIDIGTGPWNSAGSEPQLLPINRGAPADRLGRVLCLAVATEGQTRRGVGGELNAGHDT